jgi:di/tricarboxylate transporter
MLWATGVLGIDQALAGFGDPTVVYIAALFVVGEALDAIGITTGAGQQLLARAGDSHTRLLVFLMLLSAGLTAVISVNGAVATLLPVVVVLAVKLRRPASRLLMPLAYSAHAGSMLALTGTPVNVIVSDAAEGAGGDYFGFFDFTLAGVPLVAGTVVIIAVLGRRLLPDRQAGVMPKDFSDHTRTLLRQYQMDESSAGSLFTRRSGVAEVVIPRGRPWWASRCSRAW